MALHKTIIEVEVLWDDEISPNPSELSLTNIDYQITEGHCSGVVETKSDKILTKKQMRKALQKQGSDPDFLCLEDIEEDAGQIC